MANKNSYKNWQVILDDNKICWLVLDCYQSSTNVLNAEVILELNTILDNLHSNTPRALIIKSAKSNGYIAGADIGEFIQLDNAEHAAEVIRKVQLIFDKVATLPCATVAMINGFCLGGGLELSLACRYRVALDTPKTRIGLPEVTLGVQPGWGGSVRLPKLIGSLPALNLILPGKTVDARTAAKLGIVDAAVPERHFLNAALFYATKASEVRQAGKLESIIQIGFVRNLIAKILEKKLSAKVNREHYPAPYSVVDAWRKTSIYSELAFEEEAKAIGRLMVTPTARNLVHLFFLRERLKGFAKGSKFTPKHVHVVGAGVMGGDIAAWCALSGFSVTVQDQNLSAIAATCQRALDLYTKKLKLPYLVQNCTDRLIPDPNGEGIAHADVIIEAIIENLPAKQALFKQLEAQAKPDAVLATNTSTIPLNQIGTGLKNPKRIVGIHFFNPVALMQLVEVVSEIDTDQEMHANALAFVGKIDKLPLPVKSSPGFLVNRILIPYLLESAAIYEEGVPGVVIDKAVTDFGMLMGPIELMDTVGLDVCIAAAQGLGAKIPEKIVEWVKQGKLGKKSGEGFYTYKNGKPIKPKAINSSHPKDITDRLILRMVNESAACLREKIVPDADLVDAGMVFGAGFAPFRGGPMKYAQDEGKENILKRLRALESRYGDRFAPDAEWEKI